MAKTFRKPPSITKGASIVWSVTRELSIKKGLFSIEEFQATMNCMQNAKMCGLDGIPIEVGI